jgi:hypothetical protein
MFMNVHFWTEPSQEIKRDRLIAPEQAVKINGGAVVAEYRFYSLDEARNISGPTGIQQFAGDATAIARGSGDAAFTSAVIL